MTSTTTTGRVPMDSLRKTALVAGICYLITFCSIPTLAIYGPVKTELGFIVGAGSDSAVRLGGLLEVIVALAGIGAAVVLYPVVKRQNQSLALGFVATRVLEASLLFVGVVSLLTLVTLKQDLGSAAGADEASLVTTGASLVAVHTWTMLLGGTLMPVCNAFLLGTLMYRSGLVPRVIPLMGLVGAPLLLTSTIAVLFGVIEPISGWSALATLPIAAWELSLGVWLVVKGFRPSPITAGMVQTEAPSASDRVAVAVPVS